MMTSKKLTPTATHWGTYLVEVEDGKLQAIHPYPEDTTPTDLRHLLLETQDERCRIGQPMIREGYLEKGIDSDRTGRGKEPFVAVSWDQALDLTADALARVKQLYGNEAIYGGSYGWGSVGALHHPATQLHRFLNALGGHTYSVNSYSYAAAEVITPHILGCSMADMIISTPSWRDVAANSELVVLFGGAGLKNTSINVRGTGPHTSQQDMLAAKEAGVEFINISPIRDDVAHDFGATWISAVPNTDTAIMLGLAHTLVVENLHDATFIETYCVGWERFVPYLLGETDDQPKDAAWAAQISGVSASVIQALAQQMAQQKTTISVSWSLQRAEHGEQPFWMAVVLAALLGEIGLPGRGVVFGYNAVYAMGSHGRTPFMWPLISEGANPVNSFIPVARIADMLLNPRQTFDYDGHTYTYPDIKLVYWAGGNPFHHHQDLNRILAAWQKPETIIVNEPWWNA
ncbi:MAG: molybdopterin-dependent oxidoreductase, partial [Chloroflexota bacterium]